MTDIHVTSGDDYAKVGSNDRRITLTVTKDGAAVDLTGVVLRFMAKRSRYDGDNLAVISKVSPTEIETASPQTGDTKGKAYLTIDGDDTEDETGRFYWELQATDSVGRITIASGGLYIYRDLVLA